MWSDSHVYFNKEFNPTYRRSPGVHLQNVNSLFRFYSSTTREIEERYIYSDKKKTHWKTRLVLKDQWEIKEREKHFEIRYRRIPKKGSRHTRKYSKTGKQTYEQTLQARHNTSRQEVIRKTFDDNQRLHKLKK